MREHEQKMCHLERKIRNLSSLVSREGMKNSKKIDQQNVNWQNHFRVGSLSHGTRGIKRYEVESLRHTRFKEGEPKWPKPAPDIF